MVEILQETALPFQEAAQQHQSHCNPIRTMQPNPIFALIHFRIDLPTLYQADPMSLFLAISPLIDSPKRVATNAETHLTLGIRGHHEILGRVAILVSFVIQESCVTLETVERQGLPRSRGQNDLETSRNGERSRTHGMMCELTYPHAQLSRSVRGRTEIHGLDGAMIASMTRPLQPYRHHPSLKSR